MFVSEKEELITKHCCQVLKCLLTLCLSFDLDQSKPLASELLNQIPIAIKQTYCAFNFHVNNDALFVMKMIDTICVSLKNNDYT